MILDVPPQGSGNYGNKKRCKALSQSIQYLINILSIFHVYFHMRLNYFMPLIDVKLLTLIATPLIYKEMKISGSPN